MYIKIKNKIVEIFVNVFNLKNKELNNSFRNLEIKLNTLDNKLNKLNESLNAGLKLHYWNTQHNFGDQLNPILIEKLSKKRIQHFSKDECNIMAIGSLLDILFIHNKSLFPKPKLTIWGSGFMYKEKDKEILDREVNVVALRGKLSKERMEKLTGKNLKNVVLGDPGLLAYLLLEDRPAVIYDVGIIAHHSEQDNPLIDKIQKKLTNATVIDITGNVYETLNKIASCKTIISSAMHGLIVADSLGIPNKWIEFSDIDLGDGYKFRDYYSVFDLPAEKIDVKEDIIDDNTIKQIRNNYPIKHEHLKSIQQKLLESFLLLKFN